ESDDGTDRDRDRAAGALRPIRHRQPRNEASDELAALGEQTTGGEVKDLERNLEVAGHQLPGVQITPRRIADGAAFRPHAEVANRFLTPLVRPMALDGSRERERDRLRAGRAI